MYLVLAHHPFSELDRTFHLVLFGKDIYLCARCTGQYIGLAAFLLYSWLGGWPSVPLWIVCILPVFSAADWLTQTLQLRCSNNILRALTGALFGIWLGIFIQFLLSWDIKLISFITLQAVFYTAIVMLILRAKPHCVDTYLQEYEDFVAMHFAKRD